MQYARMDKMLLVGLPLLEQMPELLFLEFCFDHAPHALDRVGLWSVRKVENQL